MALLNSKTIPVYEAEQMLTDTKDAVAKCKKIMNVLKLRLERSESKLDIEERAAAACKGNYLSTDIQEISEETFSSFRYAVNDMQYLSALPPYILRSDNVQAATSLYYKEVILPADRVMAALEDDAIYVRTPMLWSRNNRKVRGANNRTIGPERCVIYRDSVEEAIRLCPNFSTYDFAKFDMKLVHYLFIYRDLPTNKQFVIDNDNHETKHVTDGISGFLPGGDSPLSCNFFMSAASSHEIPEGTYITVTPADNGAKRAADIIDFWKSAFAQAPIKTCDWDMEGE